ncbi:hypothetical protein HDU91_006117, partial [Kappamyces sp. JEL0680]
NDGRGATEPNQGRPRDGGKGQGFHPKFAQRCPDRAKQPEKATVDRRLSKTRKGDRHANRSLCQKDGRSVCCQGKGTQGV